MFNWAVDICEKAKINKTIKYKRNCDKIFDFELLISTKNKNKINNSNKI